MGVGGNPLPAQCLEEAIVPPALNEFLSDLAVQPS